MALSNSEAIMNHLDDEILPTARSPEPIETLPQVKGHVQEARRSLQTGHTDWAAHVLWQALAISEKFVGKHDESLILVLDLLAQTMERLPYGETQARELRERARRIRAWAQACEEVN
jgi:hypothetical protein